MKKTTARSQAKHATKLTLTLGPRIVLSVHTGSGRGTDLDLDNLVVNFQEALDEPHTQYHLRDYCGEQFFKNRTKTTSRQLYLATQEGNVDGADAFVVFGAHVGTLLANLELLYRPHGIELNGPLTAYFDAWSHSMGKARKKHLGSRPAHCVTILNRQGKPLTPTTVQFCKRKTDAIKRRPKKK